MRIGACQICGASGRVGDNHMCPKCERDWQVPLKQLQDEIEAAARARRLQMVEAFVRLEQPRAPWCLRCTQVAPLLKGYCSACIQQMNPPREFNCRCIVIEIGDSSDTPRPPLISKRHLKLVENE